MVTSSWEFLECSRSYHQVEKTQAGCGWSFKAKGCKSTETSASHSKKVRRTQGVGEDCTKRLPSTPKRVTACFPGGPLAINAATPLWFLVGLAEPSTV